MTIRANFINPETGLYRAGWRIAAFMALFIAISIVLTALWSALGGSETVMGPRLVISAIGATLSIYLSRKYLDKRDMTSLGLKWDKTALLDIFFGVLLAALLMAGIYFIMLMTGLIEFKGFSWWTGAVAPEVRFALSVLPAAFHIFFLLVVVAWWEELVFRGYVLQNLIAGIGVTWSVILTSLLFGFLHYTNPNATILSSLLIALLTPMLIYAYLKTGQLWLPMGIHLGWNFFQGSVFGFAVSGGEFPSLISQDPVGPDWLSGGAFGAEGSILTVPFVLFSLFAIHWWAARTRQPGQRFLEFRV